MKDYSNKIITIPNILSFIRILLIPVFVLFYVYNNYFASFIVVAVSGITDVVDGFIARRFNMVSAFGKALDPVADKLTQIAIFICLCFSFQYICVPLTLLIVKEVTIGVLSLKVVEKTGTTYSANWYGKLSTATIYFYAIAHILWKDIPLWLSITLTVLCVATMIFAFIMYGIRNSKVIKEYTSGKNESAKESSLENKAERKVEENLSNADYFTVSGEKTAQSYFENKTAGQKCGDFSTDRKEVK